MDTNVDRLVMVQKFGAIPVVGGKITQNDRIKMIREKTGHGLDLVVEACGQPEVVKEGLDLLRFGGHLVTVGMVHPQSQLSEVTGYQIIHKCATIHGTHNYGPSHLDQALQFLSATIEKYNFQDLISEPYMLEDMDKAFDAASKQKWLRVCVKLNESE